MSIVIDINVISMVFDVGNANHADFAPVKAWIERGEGFLLFGGTKYLSELAKSLHYIRLVRQLKEVGRAVEILSEVVDALQVGIENLTVGTKCNDQHLIALLAAAHCSLVCSNDKASFSYLKNRTLYPGGCPRVRIYSSSRNTALLIRYRRDSIRNVKQ